MPKTTPENRTELFFIEHWQKVRRHPDYIALWRRLQEHRGQDEYFYAPGDPDMRRSEAARVMDDEAQDILERFKFREYLWHPRNEPEDLQHVIFGLFDMEEVKVIFPPEPAETVKAGGLNEAGIPISEEIWTPIWNDKTLRVHIDLSGRSSKVAILAEVERLLDENIPKVSERFTPKNQHWLAYDMKLQGKSSKEIADYFGDNDMPHADITSVDRLVREARKMIESL